MPQNDPEQKPPQPPHPYSKGGYKEHLKPIFLREFPKFGSIQSTAKSIDLDRKTVTRWRETDPEFNQAFMDADSIVTESLESTAMARALKDSDTLMIFLLKARDPAKYKDRYLQEIDPRTIDLLVGQFIDAVRKRIPDVCPHCKVNLNLTNEIAKELDGLSSRLAGG